MDIQTKYMIQKHESTTPTPQNNWIITSPQFQTGQCDTSLGSNKDHCPKCKRWSRLGSSSTTSTLSTIWPTLKSACMFSCWKHWLTFGEQNESVYRNIILTSKLRMNLRQHLAPALLCQPSPKPTLIVATRILVSSSINKGSQISPGRECVCYDSFAHHTLSQVGRSTWIKRINIPPHSNTSHNTCQRKNVDKGR